MSEALHLGTTRVTITIDVDGDGRQMDREEQLRSALFVTQRRLESTLIMQTDFTRHKYFRLVEMTGRVIVDMDGPVEEKADA